LFDFFAIVVAVSKVQHSASGCMEWPSPKWPIMCRAGRKTTHSLTQSYNVAQASSYSYWRPTTDRPTAHLEKCKRWHLCTGSRDHFTFASGCGWCCSSTLDPCSWWLRQM